MSDQRPGRDDRTRAIPAGPGAGGAARPPQPTAGQRAPDAPPGAGVTPAGARPERRRTLGDGGGPGGSGGSRGGGSGGRDGGGRSARGTGSAGGPPTRRRRKAPFGVLALVVVLAIVAYPIALLLVGWNHLGRIDALPSDTASTPGRTYLVVGSDSRKGLTKEQAKTLLTGRGDVGQRTDTIMLLHVPAGGGPTVLMSIPRDSYVAIPGHDKNKINAAFAFGGPKLLARTIEQLGGVQIDDYAEIGFGGFASMVDAVGGVQICPKRAMKDKDAGINQKGCQQADGPTTLGYARARHSDPRGDLGRVERQREVLAAIVTKASRPTTLVNPFKTFPLASSGGGSLTVDQHTGPLALLRFVLGMKGAAGDGGVSLTLPVSGSASRSGAGSVVLLDEKKDATVWSALKRSDTESLRAIAAEQKKLAR